MSADPALIARFGGAIHRASQRVHQRLEAILAAAPLATATVDEVIDATEGQMTASDDLTSAISELKGLTLLWSPASLSDFLGALALRKEEEEDLVRNTVNIMTAHKAKGLDACVVILRGGRGGVVSGPWPRR